MSDFPSPTGLYKVLDSDLRPYHGGAGEWQVGVERRVSGELVPCLRGLHAVTLAQLPRWLGPAIHPVLEVSEERRDDDDKWVFRTMTIGPAYETWDERTQRHFACDCAERALGAAKRLHGWQDERCNEAVRIARRYADGLADEAALAAAWSAAWAAAESAAESAAWAAGGAAAEAAESAARASSAESAAWAAAVAAQNVAIAWQAKRLARYLRGELP